MSEAGTSGAPTQGIRVMRLKFRVTLLAAGLAVAALPVLAQQIIIGPPIVGGAPMVPTTDIFDNAAASSEFTMLIADVRAAGLVDTLRSPGPFTVFAPSNKAFAAQPLGTADPGSPSRPDVAKIVTNHIVAGRLSMAALNSMIDMGNGHTTLTTMSGGTLTVVRAGNMGLTITDETGQVGQIIYPDLYQSNGVIHIVDKVLMPY
jgi:uncharacterized surface protein with fasciclin (FAS1) repeats